MKKLIIASVVTLILVNVLLQGVYLAIANSLASESVAAEQLKEEIAQLQEKNQIQEAKVLAQSSLQHVFTRAEELGFMKPKTVLTLQDSDSVALVQN